MTHRPYDEDFKNSIVALYQHGCRDMFALTAKIFEHMSMEAQKWQKKLLKKQMPRLEILGTATYVILLLVIVDICVHIYFRRFGVSLSALPEGDLLRPKGRR